MVAIFCGKLLDGERPVVFGDGLQTRDYVHVDDVVEREPRRPRSPDAGGPFNIGTGVETTVLDLVEALAPHAPTGVHAETTSPSARARCATSRSTPRARVRRSAGSRRCARRGLEQTLATSLTASAAQCSPLRIAIATACAHVSLRACRSGCARGRRPQSTSRWRSRGRSPSAIAKDSRCADVAVRRRERRSVASSAGAIAMCSPAHVASRDDGRGRRRGARRVGAVEPALLRNGTRSARRRISRGEVVDRRTGPPRASADDSPASLRRRSGAGGRHQHRASREARGASPRARAASTLAAEVRSADQHRRRCCRSRGATLRMDAALRRRRRRLLVVASRDRDEGRSDGASAPWTPRGLPRLAAARSLSGRGSSRSCDFAGESAANL